MSEVRLNQIIDECFKVSGLKSKINSITENP
jgi:hypothetical protein